MPAFCKTSDASLSVIDDYNAWTARQQIVLQAVGGIEILSWIAGLVLIFIWRTEETKSRFIRVLWILISLANLFNIAEIILATETTNAVNEKDLDKVNKLQGYQDKLYVASTCLVSITHWVFAIKYFEAVFQFLMTVAPQDGTFQAKQKKLRCSIKTANISYYTIIGAWALVSYLQDADYDTTFLVMLIIQTAFCQVTPAALLVFSVQKLSQSIKDIRGFSVREKLVCIHTVVFIGNICINLAFLVSQIILRRTDYEQHWSKHCRATISQAILQEAVSVTNIVTLWLVIFVTLQLMKPLTTQWRDSTRLCQGQGLDSVQQEAADTESSARERAQRQHDAAYEDANRLIRFYQALLLQGDDKTESQVSLDESQLSITSEERNILGDSFVTETDEELFARVRREAAGQMLRPVSINVKESTLSSNDTEGTLPRYSI